MKSTTFKVGQQRLLKQAAKYIRKFVARRQKAHDAGLR